MRSRSPTARARLERRPLGRQGRRLGTDLVTDFLARLAEGAGITLHVRLIAGDDAQHVLEAMFKALGVALSQACRTRRKE